MSLARLQPASTTDALAPLSQASALQRIPSDQLAAFSAETTAAQRYILRWISIVDPLREVKGREKLWPILARQTGEKPGNIRRKFYHWLDGIKGKHTPIWEGLINRSRFPAATRRLDLRFEEHWRRLRESSRRLNDGGREAHRVLLSDLRAWEADPANPSLIIPGCGSTPPVRDSYCADSRQFVPRGWSYGNLIRKKSSQLNIVNIITGPKAASAYLPKNLATRAGLAYREILFSDDQDYDNDVVTFLNRGEAMRPQGFNTLDYLTAHFETWGMQLRRRDSDSGKRRGIDQEFYVWTILADLMRHGFRDDERGTRIIREHATAKGYTKLDGHGDNFDDVIHHITNGRVTMDASGRFDQPLFTQMLFAGRGKQAAGNFRFKAPLESAFHRVRTQSSFLLGDVGNRYQVNPEQNAALDAYTNKLWKALSALPADQQELTWNLLHFPKHTWHEFSHLMGLVYSAVNRRGDHKLEGWSEAGFVVPGWAMHNPMDPSGAPQLITREQFLTMGPEQQQYIQTFGRDHLIVLSPAEAAELSRQRDRRHLVKLSHEIASLALPEAWAYPVRQGISTGLRVRDDGTFNIKDPERFGTTDLQYIAHCHVPTGERVPLNPGDKYLLWICPFDPDEAIVKDMNGRYRGTVLLNQRPVANDIAARLRNQGRIDQFRSDATRDSERRHHGTVQRHDDMIRHNNIILPPPNTPPKRSTKPETSSTNPLFDDVFRND